MTIRRPLLATAALLGLLAWPARAAEPPAKATPEQPGKSEKPDKPEKPEEPEKPEQPQVITIDQGRIALDKRKRTIRVPGYFCCEEGPLEYLICLVRGKEYESVFAANCDARQLNIALLALGYRAGGDVGRLGDPRLPRGDAVTLTIEWTDAEGAKRSGRGEDFMFNVYTKKPMRRTPWIYTGSRFDVNPMTERREYLAQMDGVIAATYRDPAAVFNSPLNTGVDDVFYTVHSKIVPKRGTAGTLVIAPSEAPKPDELDDGAKLAPGGAGENPPEAPERREEKPGEKPQEEPEEKPENRPGEDAPEARE